jgi:hypothetical protein
MKSFRDILLSQLSRGFVLFLLEKRLNPACNSSNWYLTNMPDIDFADDIWAVPKHWIKQQFHKEISEEKVIQEPMRLINPDLVLPIDTWLQFQSSNGWPDFAIGGRSSADTWKNLVKLMYRDLPGYQRNHYSTNGQPVRIVNVENFPDDYAWPLYLNRLSAKPGWDRDSIVQFEDETIRIMRRINTNKPPFRGLVMGHVQSGKTASFAGIMALAADLGYNVFIVLSGIIDNLRAQTEDRLLRDLGTGNGFQSKVWTRFFHAAGINQFVIPDRDFTAGSRQRYLHVFLKNTHHLTRLKQWLDHDRNQKKNMRILIIDDEADQATPNMNRPELDPTRINQKIMDILFNDGYNEIAYLGYTATPYANVLSTSPALEKTLYPNDMIACLQEKKEYFGCRRIFGEEFGDEGMDVVRLIPQTEIDQIKEVHAGTSKALPQSVLSSLKWFIISAAIRRFWEYSEPTSMLLHTSHLITNHENLHIRIIAQLKGWKDNIEAFLGELDEFYKREKTQFSKASLIEYDIFFSTIEIRELPELAEIQTQIKQLFTIISPIQLGDNKNIVHHQGIHVCMDNSAPNEEANLQMKLIYPKSDDAKGEAFIVVGGNTLSRGLTLEGLVSSWFLRDSTAAADSLMQMGRWFGYRKGYELLPRVWVSERTKAKFASLSRLESNFRQNINDLAAEGISPADEPLKVLNDLYRLKATSVNRRRAAFQGLTHSGSSPQMTRFIDENEALKQNLGKTQDLISNLMSEIQPETTDSKIIFRAVAWETIKKFLYEFSYASETEWFSRVKEYLPNVQTTLGSVHWNVVLSGTDLEGSSGNAAWSIPEASHIGKVNRARFKENTKGDLGKYLEIGVLRDPRDLTGDIPRIKYPGSREKALELRENQQVAGIPLLIVYCIEGDAPPHKETRYWKGTRELAAISGYPDLIGLSVLFPGRKNAGNYLTVKALEEDQEFESKDNSPKTPDEFDAD